jgi:hypothetical protein
VINFTYLGHIPDAPLAGIPPPIPFESGGFLVGGFVVLLDLLPRVDLKLVHVALAFPASIPSLTFVKLIKNPMNIRKKGNNTKNHEKAFNPFLHNKFKIYVHARTNPALIRRPIK